MFPDGWRNRDVLRFPASRVNRWRDRWRRSPVRTCPDSSVDLWQDRTVRVFPDSSAGRDHTISTYSIISHHIISVRRSTVPGVAKCPDSSSPSSVGTFPDSSAPPRPLAPSAPQFRRSSVFQSANLSTGAPPALRHHHLNHRHHLTLVQPLVRHHRATLVQPLVQLLRATLVRSLVKHHRVTLVRSLVQPHQEYRMNQVLLEALRGSQDRPCKQAMITDLLPRHRYQAVTTLRLLQFLPTMTTDLLYRHQYPLRFLPMMILPMMT